MRCARLGVGCPHARVNGTCDKEAVDEWAGLEPYDRERDDRMTEADDDPWDEEAT